MIGKFMSKVIQSLPSWEVTKYYGRVCWFQVQCLKYRIQTSEAWFHFKSKYMPGRLRNEAEQDNKCGTERGKQVETTGRMSGSKESSLANELLARIPKSAVLKEKLEKLLADRKKAKEEESSQAKSEVIGTKSEKCIKKTGASNAKQRK